MEDATRLTRPDRRTRRLAAVGLLGATALLLLAGSAWAAAGAAAADSARVLAARAREEAARDDHAAAIADASAAIALDPSLEADLSLLLAHQLTWSDRPAEAIPWYRRCVAREPRNRDARLGLARALSWTGELSEARTIYEQLLADDPEDVDARLGLARVHAWDDDPSGASREYQAALDADSTSVDARRGLADAENRRGRHRVAEKLYRDLLARNPKDTEARVGLARALYWMGESELALAELEDVDVDGAAASDLRREVSRDEGSSLDLAASRWIDRDDQELDSVRLAATRGVGGGVRLVAEGELFRANDPTAPEIAGSRVALGADWRRDRALALHGRLGLLNVGGNLDDDVVIDVGEGETRDAEAVREQYLLWEAWATWTPADRTRFDLSSVRVPILTPRALARGIRADVLSLGADRSIADRLVARASVASASFTDDNDRVGGEAELEAGPFRVSRAQAWVGVGALAFRFDESPEHGYYSPETYDAVFTSARLRVPLGARASVEGDARLASEREESGDRFGVLNGGVELRVPLGRGFGASAFARKSTSRFDTGAGYEREGWGVSLFFSP